MANYAFINGEVITVDAQDRICSALLVTGKHITAVGSDAEILAQADDHQVIDLQGRTLMPGFIDAHNHLTHQGAAFATVDFGYPAVASIEDLRNAVREAAENSAPGKWIRGWGMNYEKFAGGQQPTRWDLDDISLTILYASSMSAAITYWLTAWHWKWRV
nr:amidohydrolase family protein [Aliamphritea spongicola]